MARRIFLLALLAALVVAVNGQTATAQAADSQLMPMTNLRSGISVVPQAQQGVDWLYERRYHDEKVDDAGILYIRANTPIVLEHNDNNVVSQDQRYVQFPRVIGRHGPDGKPDSGDEGIIKWMINNNYRAPAYVGEVRPPTRLYEKPIVLSELTYSDGKPIIGTTGHNDLPWTAEKRGDPTRWFYGQVDADGNQWHEIRYWDDDTWTKSAQSAKCNASDGGRIVIMVDPKTPVLQLSAGSDSAQWYTTPPKTFDTPHIHPMTTCLTSGVRIHMVNMTNAEPVEYAITEIRKTLPADSEWQTYDGTPLPAEKAFARPKGRYMLYMRCGRSGPIGHRLVEFNPDFPATGEKHGYLLWEDDAQRDRLRANLQKEPWKSGFARISATGEDPEAGLDSPVRRSWRGESGRARAALNHAFSAVMKDWKVDGGTDHGYIAKRNLLRFYTAEPLGIEVYLSTTGGSPDLTPLGQEWLDNYVAPLAYDLLAAGYRRSEANPRGMSPIEELKIRDNLAQLAKLWQQFRFHMAAGVGSGSSHWELGYGLVAMTTALAMPSYDTRYYGTSGANGAEAGNKWAPYPDEALSWWENLVRTGDGPGRPNSIASWRYHIIYNKQGYWIGPNHLAFIKPDGQRIHYWQYRHNRGQPGQPVYSEGGGYENPFVGPGAAIQNILQIAGKQPLDSYMRYYERKVEDGHVLPAMANHRWPFAPAAAAIVARQLEIGRAHV